MTATATPIVDIANVNGNTITIEQLTALHDAYFTWQTTAGETVEAAQRNWDVITRETGRYYHHKDIFLGWLRDHPEHNVQPVAVEPIGPETPGWVEWWQRLAEHAEEDGYEEQFNILARAFDVEEIDDESTREHEYYVDVDVSMTVRLHVTASERDIDNNGVEEYFDESDVDEAIRQYIRNNSAEYSVTDYGVN